MFIYKITNRLNGKPYVGQTKQPIEKRFLQHSKASTPLGQAMRECGIENFTIEIIEECKTPEQAKKQECFWIRALKCKVPNGYNRSDGGESPYSRKPKPQSPPPVDSSIQMTIAESLRRFRKEFNLKQKDVADTLGVKQPTYNVYESKSVPSAAVIVKLANAYNVTTDYLLGQSDEPRPLKFDKKTLTLLRAMEDKFQTGAVAQ